MIGFIQINQKVRPKMKLPGGGTTILGLVFIGVGSDISGCLAEFFVDPATLPTEEP